MQDFISVYPLTREMISDSFNIITNHVLKEAYDKHNQFIKEDDWIKVKHKSISTIEKYTQTVKGIGSYIPYFGILWLSFGTNSIYGKQMAYMGLLLAIFVTWELKKPCISATEENQAIQQVEFYRDHPKVLKFLGESSSKWTYF